MHLMISSREVDSLRVQLSERIFMRKRQNSECNVENFRRFFFGMSSDVPAFKVCIFASDFKFCLGVNEY